MISLNLQVGYSKFSFFGDDVHNFLLICVVALREWYGKYIQIFLTTWNQLRVSLATNGKYKPNINTGLCTSVSVIWPLLKCRCSGEIKIPAEFCRKDLDLRSDLKVLLPRRQGPGLCSTALVSYLIALHNEFVYCVDNHTGEETRWGRSYHIFLSCPPCAVRTHCGSPTALYICAQNRQITLPSYITRGVIRWWQRW